MDQVHEVLHRQLQLPDYYGMNLDALWDCLTGFVELPVTIEWRGFGESRALLGTDIDRVLETLRDAEAHGVAVVLK